MKVNCALCEFHICFTAYQYPDNSYAHFCLAIINILFHKHTYKMYFVIWGIAMTRTNETVQRVGSSDMPVAPSAVNGHVYDYIMQMLAELAKMAQNNGLSDSARFIDAALLVIRDQQSGHSPKSDVDGNTHLLG